MRPRPVDEGLDSFIYLDKLFAHERKQEQPDQREGADGVPVIELHGLTKRFGDVVAVDELSFEVDSAKFASTALSAFPLMFRIKSGSRRLFVVARLIDLIWG